MHSGKKSYQTIKLNLHRVPSFKIVICQKWITFIIMGEEKTKNWSKITAEALTNNVNGKRKNVLEAEKNRNRNGNWKRINWSFNMLDKWIFL